MKSLRYRRILLAAAVAFAAILAGASARGVTSGDMTQDRYRTILDRAPFGPPPPPPVVEPVEPEGGTNDVDVVEQPPYVIPPGLDKIKITLLSRFHGTPAAGFLDGETSKSYYLLEGQEFDGILCKGIDYARATVTLSKGGYEALIEDTHEITLETKAYAKELIKEKIPYILLGHSMGSMVVRCYIRKYDADIDKLVVIGCPSKKPGMKPGLALIKMVTNIKGEKTRSKFISDLVVGDYEKRFKKEGVPHMWVNSDPEKVKKYNEDPLCNYMFTLNGYLNLVKLTMLTYTDGGYVMKNPALPIRFFSGAEDPCAVNEKAFAEAMELLRKQGYTDVDGIMYPRLRHEILNEDKKDMVYEDILNFIK